MGDRADTFEPVAYAGVSAAAKAAGLSRSAFYNEIKAGRVTGRRYGRRVVFEKSEIERFVRSLPTTSAR
jgi:predicted DNA-binding transcriptional regulator AlpA